VEGLLERAIEGHGAVVGVVGSPGIGKSRLVREVSAMAAARSVEVFTAFCESHTNQVPFHAVARLLLAIECATAFPTQTPRTCAFCMTCWASPTRMLRHRQSIPMPVGDG